MSALGKADALSLPDPVFLIPSRYLLWIVAVIEMSIASVLICEVPQKMKFSALIWISTCFIVYRISLYWIDPRHLCPCLGLVGDNLPIPGPYLDPILKLLIAYLFGGSLFFLIRNSFAGKPISVVDAAANYVQPN